MTLSHILINLIQCGPLNVEFKNRLEYLSRHNMIIIKLFALHVQLVDDSHFLITQHHDDTLLKFIIKRDKRQ